jgi:hypothetical protein
VSRTRTANEYIGKVLETPLLSALEKIKTARKIKHYFPTLPKKYGGDFDAIIQLSSGRFLDVECMNFNTKYAYSERADRIGGSTKGLPTRLIDANKIFNGKVKGVMLIITN